METMKFKTNAKCGGCVSAIGAKLNVFLKPEDWSINLTDPNKILEVKAEISPDAIQTAVRDAGFKVEQL